MRVSHAETLAVAQLSELPERSGKGVLRHLFGIGGYERRKRC